MKKLLFLGDEEVGKSKIIQQYIYEKYTENYDATVGETFKKVVNFQNQNFELTILDCSGNDEYKSFWKNEIGTSDLVYIVYSIDNYTSFQACEKFFEEVTQFERKIPIILLGNKMELEKAVSFREAKELADKYQATYLDTSAKNKYLIEEVFNKGFELIFQKEKELKEEEEAKLLDQETLKPKMNKKMMSFFHSSQAEPKSEKEISRTKSFLNILISPRRERNEKVENSMALTLVTPRNYNQEQDVEKLPQDSLLSKAILSPRMEKMYHVLEKDKKALKIVSPKYTSLEKVNENKN